MQQGLKTGILSLLLALVGSGCLGSSNSGSAGTSTTGPIDGSYTINGLTCNGTTTSYLPTGAAAQMVVIANTTGSFITTYLSGCVNTEGNVFAYPSSSSFSMQKVNRVCSGAGCSGSECTADSTAGTASTFSYTVSGTTMTMTHTSDGNDGCANGQTTVYTATKN